MEPNLSRKLEDTLDKLAGAILEHQARLDALAHQVRWLQSTVARLQALHTGPLPPETETWDA